MKINCDNISLLRFYLLKIEIFTCSYLFLDIYCVSLQRNTIDVPLIINSTTRQVYIQLDLDDDTGALTVPDTGDNRIRRDLGMVHEACNLHEGKIWVELASVSVTLIVRDGYIRPESFVKIQDLVRKISLKDYDTLIEAIKCLGGFEQTWDGLLGVDDRKHAFDVVGRFSFKLSGGDMETIHFRIHEICDCGDQLKQIQANYNSSIERIIHESDNAPMLYALERQVKANYSKSIEYMIQGRRNAYRRTRGRVLLDDPAFAIEEFVEIYGDFDDTCTLCSSAVTVLLHVAALPFIFLVTVLVL